MSKDGETSNQYFQYCVTERYLLNIIKKFGEDQHITVTIAHGFGKGTETKNLGTAKSLLKRLKNREEIIVAF
jgi:hypothetical protein